MSEHEPFWNWGAWLRDEKNIEHPFQKETSRRYNAHPLLVGNIISLEAENKRLREALGLFVQVYDAPMTSEYSGSEALASAISSARSALNEKGA
jgi:hypothetical protein